MAALEASGGCSIHPILTNNVDVAQLVEHSPEEPGVGGSIPFIHTILCPVNVVIRWFRGNVTELGARFKSDAGRQ